jgi:predicted patatin/cPLA2 family phospholipase
MIYLVITLSLALYGVDGRRCRALAIGGGTDLGAYEAGVIIGLIQNLPPGEAEWDVVTGVGVGAINGLIVSMYAQGEESEAASKLSSFWSNFNYESFYVDWKGGVVTGLLSKTGLYDTTPMKKTISSLQTNKFQRTLGVGATDLLTANYVYFGSNQQSESTMSVGVLASASDYGIFPIVDYSSFQLLSGSILYSVDLIRAINTCQSLGAQLKDISIDVVLGAGKTINSVDASSYKTIQVLLRYLQINSYNSVMKAITNALHDFPGINIRSTVFPSKNIPSALYPYDYSKSQILQQISLGVSDGKQASGQEIIVDS